MALKVTQYRNDYGSQVVAAAALGGQQEALLNEQSS
jgi:hypothetical protein